MSFSQQDIERVREANNIVDVIGSYTNLKRAGHNWMGLCPFPSHVEKTGSFSVSEDKQVYHCFGCKKAGNLFTFVQEMKGLSFPEAIEDLAKRAGITVTPINRGYETQVDREWMEMGEKINDYAMKFYHEQYLKLPDSHPVKKYVNERGLKKETVEQFQIGWAGDEWSTLANRLQNGKNPQTIPVALKMGLIKAQKTGRGHFDLFRSRLMFPIINVKGACVGFGGRVVGEGQPKYLNSLDSDVFHKGQTFYGLNETAKHIRSSDGAIIVEGYMDFLALYQAGVKNVVATLGTALTPQHAKIIKKHTLNACVVFDGDAAGIMASDRSLPVMLSQGLRPRNLNLPHDEDPDEYVMKHGGAEFKKQVARSEDLFTAFLRRKTENSQRKQADRLAILDEIAEVVQATDDPRMRDLMIDEVATALTMEKDMVKKALMQARKPAAAALTETPTLRVPSIEAKISLKGAPKAELTLLTMALVNEEYWKLIWQSEVMKELSSSEVQKVFEMAHDAYRQMANKFATLPAFLASYVDSASAIGLTADKMWQELSEEKARRLIADCIKKIKEAGIKNQAKKKLADLKTKSSEDQMRELEQFMNIQSARKNLQHENQS